MRIGKNNTVKNQKFVLTKSEQEFVKDLSRKVVVRAYLINSQRKPKDFASKVRNFFFKSKVTKVLVINILETLEECTR